jgi:hypothetical protein
MTVVCCDEQSELDTIRDAFEIELKEAHTKQVKRALEIDSDEEMSKEQKSTVEKTVKKKIGTVMDHVRVVKSGGNYAFIQRAPEKLTWQQWALQCMLTDEQKKAVLSCLPDPSMEPQPSLLAFLDPAEDLEATCKLKKAQLGCWAQLAGSMRKQ